MLRLRRPSARLVKALGTVGATAALALMASLLSGCGSSTLDPVARAAFVSSHEPGARVSYDMRISSTAVPSLKLTMRGSGHLDLEQKALAITMHINGRSPRLAALPSTTLHEIAIFPVIYMELPKASAATLPNKKPWLEINLRKAASAAGVSPQLFSTEQESNPAQYLEYLRLSSGRVTKLGEESIDGVATTHYRASLTLSDILNRLPASQRASTRLALHSYGEPNVIHIDVWVDGKHRVRRMLLPMHMRIPAAASESGAASGNAKPTDEITATVQIDFRSYGPVAPITPPPASEVFEATG